MSFIKARKRIEEAPQTEHSSKCVANGCPCRATVSSSGPFSCIFHHVAVADNWPMVTEALIKHRQLRIAIDEVLSISDSDWNRGKWEMMDMYFDGNDYLRPSIEERQHKVWYYYRLMDWLMYLTGNKDKQPVPRKELPKAKPGSFANVSV